MFTSEDVENVGREQNSTLGRWKVQRDGRELGHATMDVSQGSDERVAERLNAYEAAHGPAATDEALARVLRL